VAISKRGAERLESGNVAGQFKYPEYAQDPEYLSGLGNVLCSKT
jgi:hypothetical protein